MIYIYLKNKKRGAILPNFTKVKNYACDILLSQGDNLSVPIKLETLDVGKTIIYDTMQNYAKLTSGDINTLTCNGKLKNGYHLNFNGFSLVLSNEEHCNYRQTWTKAHELGHIILGHTKDENKEEVEAHFFAAQLLMPDALIRYLIENGIKINISTLKYFFGVSDEAAAKKISTLRKCALLHSHDNDIIRLFSSQLDRLIYDLNSYNYNYEFAKELCF